MGEINISQIPKHILLIICTFVLIIPPISAFDSYANAYTMDLTNITAENITDLYDGMNMKYTGCLNSTGYKNNGLNCSKLTTGNFTMNSSLMLATGSQNYTVNFWVRAEQPVTSVSTLLNKGSYILGQGAGSTMIISVYVSSAWLSLCNVTLPEDNWVMLTLMSDSNHTQYCYYNGTYNNTRPYTLTGNNKIWRWNAEGDSPANYGNFTYDEITIFNRTLSPDEVTALYNNYTSGLQYPFVAPEGAGANPIEFVSQVPSDINILNVIGTRLNITYNVTNNTDLTRTFLNYSFNGSGCVFTVNKTCETLYNTYYQHDNDTTTSGTFPNFLFGDNGIYPATYNINESLIEATSHAFTTLSNSNDYLLVTLNNISIKRYNFFEIMGNTTGTSEVYYCNKSFAFTNPSLSSYCVQFGTLNNSGFNHTHSADSKHNFFSFPINTSSGKIGTLSVSSTGYFILRGGTGTTHIYNVPLTSGAYYYKNSTNAGSSWTNMSSVTIDAHLHQYNGTESFNYQGCTNKSGTVFCTSTRSDNLDVTILPPTAPGITNPSTDAQNGTNYFNITWTASITFNSSITIQGYNVTLLNNDTTFNQTLIGNTTNTSYYFDLYNLNLSVGSYRFKVTAIDSNGGTSFDISPYINLNNNALLNVSVVYGLSNEILSNYTLNVTDTITGVTSSYQSNTTTNKTYLEIVRGRNYNFTIDATGYAVQNFSNYNFNYTYNNVTFSIYTSNSVLITVYDESTMIILNTTTVSITFTNNATAMSYTTSNGTFYKDGLTDGTWEVKFYATNYSYRTYSITVNNRSFQTLSAYLVPSTYLCVFTVRDSLTLEALQSVSFTVQRLTNGSYVTVESRYTDIGGNVQIGFLPGIEYRFTLSKTGYSSNVFSLNPIIFNSYNVYLDRTATLNNTFDYGLVSVVFYPKTFYNGVLNNLTFVISSPEGVLTSYAVGITGKGTTGSDSDTGTDANGETFTLQFNISNATIFTRVNLTYNYTSTVAGFRSYRFQYGITGAYNVGNNTIINLQTENYGMGTFEKVLIVMIALAIISGFAFMLGGLGGSLVVGLIVLNVSVYLGFLPLWSVIITDILAVVLLVAVSVGGNK